MALALSIFCVVFAAFCVWLVVRIANRRERWAKWTLIGLLIIPALYVASFGPAIYLHYTYSPTEEFFYQAYAPIFSLVDTPDGPLYGTRAATLIWWYVEIWRPYDSGYRLR